MTTVITGSINGIGNIPVQAEYTDDSLNVTYGNAINSIINAFNVSPSSLTTVNASQYFNDIVSGVQTLTDLAENGSVVNGQQNYITANMANNISNIFSSLQAAGFDPTATDPQTQINLIEQWQDLGSIGLSNILDTAVNSLQANSSLQSMIELDYVATGNNQIYNALSTLDQATTLTNTAMNLLNEVQSLHNQILPENDSASQTAQTLISQWENATFLVNGSNGNNRTGASAGNVSPDGLTSVFQGSLGNALNTPIGTVVGDPTTNTPGLTSTVVAQYNSLRAQLQQTITQLDQINGTYAGGPNANERSGTLQDLLSQVLNEMQPGGTAPTSPTSSGTGIYAWILDGYNSATSATAGNNQETITNAISTGESLSNTQQQQLQEQLFVYQEFTQSANTMLTTINQIIQTMATDISR